jgi:hypothetical protein
MDSHQRRIFERALERELGKNSQPATRPSKGKPREVQQTEKTIRPRILEYAIVRTGVPLAIVAAGAGSMTANLFIPGVILLYLGLGLFALDIAYEDFFHRLHLSIRLLLGLIYVVVIAIVSQTWIFRLAPFEIMATSSVPVYGPGSKINGIDWLPNYSDLQFYIKNPSAVDYDNFDAEISTNLVISDLRQLRVLSDCKIASTHQPIHVHSQRMIGNQPVGPVDDSNIKYQIIPFDKNGRPLLPGSEGADWSYRVRCDKIPANSQFDFFAALEVVDDSFPKVLDAPLFEPPQPASWISITAGFQISGRNRMEAIPRCPIGMTPCEAGRSQSLLGRWLHLLGSKFFAFEIRGSNQFQDRIAEKIKVFAVLVVGTKPSQKLVPKILFAAQVAAQNHPKQPNLTHLTPTESSLSHLFPV